MISSIWWVWLTAALILAIVEVVIPGFIFLGFAIGAAVVGAILWVGLTFDLSWLLVIFALVSLIAWIVLRRTIGVRRGQARTFHHDINED